MKETIEYLLPHRAPFLFVDEIIRADEKEVVGIKTFDKEQDKMLTGSFPEHEFVPGMIIVESMAQCGGAGIKKCGLAQGLFGLMGLDKVRFLKGVNYGAKVEYRITNLKISSKFFKQSGTAYVDSKPVAEATWVCARIEE